ncbi:MAG: CHASE2 domain-containing protein [Cyanobacteria bacterium J06623_4]
MLFKRKTPSAPVSITHAKQAYDAWFKRCFNQRRRGEQQVAANRLGLLSGLVVSAISVGFSAIGAWNVLEQQSYNLLHQARREFMGAPQWDDRIAVITIDDLSVETLGPYPWTRDRYTDLLDKLAGVQPAVVAFNVLFPDTSEQDPQLAQAIVDNANVVLSVGTNHRGRYIDVADTLAAPAEGFFLRGDAGILTDDDGVSRRLRLYGAGGNPSLGVATLQVYAEVMAGTLIAESNLSTLSHLQFSPDALPASVQQGEVPNIAIPGTDAPNIDTPSTHFQQTSSTTFISPIDSSLLEPQPSPKTSATGPTQTSQPTASAHNATQPKSSTRRHFPSAFEQSALKQLSDISNPSEVSTSLVIDPQTVIKRLLPTEQTVWINWPGEVTAPYESSRPGDLQTYSYADVVNGQVDASVFQNKIVLVGATLAGIDPLRTPFQKSPPVSGVYLYAATIDNLLNQSYLRRLPQWQALLLLVGLAIGGSHLLRRQDASGRLVAVVGFPLLWSAIAYSGFTLGWWLPIAAPIGTVFLSALAVQLHEQQEKQQLMALFSMNVSPGTAELIWRHKGEILDQGELAAQNLTATVLFMDIRGFTGIAEILPSQKLLPWLNQYFETMTDCIMENGGMVDKYIGDAIMAVFGAPVPRTHPDEIKADAIAALTAAIEMHDRLTLLNCQLTAQRLPTIKFGIGIHTGPLVGGTVGNRNRLNYSLFGDTVNVAARLETMTKSLPDTADFNVLVSAETRVHAREKFPLKPFTVAPLRGRKDHVEVYTLAAKTDFYRYQPTAVETVTPMDAERTQMTPALHS